MMSGDVNQSTGEIVSPYNVPPDSALRHRIRYGLVMVTKQQANMAAHHGWEIIREHRGGDVTIGRGLDHPVGFGARRRIATT